MPCRRTLNCATSPSMVPLAGLEPATPYSLSWSGWQELNLQPQRPKRRVHPLHLIPIVIPMFYCVAVCTKYLTLGNLSKDSFFRVAAPHCVTEIEVLFGWVSVMELKRSWMIKTATGT